MRIVWLIIIVWCVVNTKIIAQINYTVPTVVIVENSVFTAPVYGASIDIIMKEVFDNNKRPISTRVGKYKTDKKGRITVSLQPNKNYTITIKCQGFFSQIAKINTQNFSRTRRNRKGISLRPRNVLAIRGNIIAGKNIKVLGQIALTNKKTEHTELQKINIDGSFFIKALQYTDYTLRVLVDKKLDTLIDLTELDLQGSTVLSPYEIKIKLGSEPNYAKGDTLHLDNMLFVGRTTNVDNEVWLDTLSSILLKNPSVRFKINIYTDARKSDRANYILAKKRVKVVEEELNKRGIVSNQYIFEALGEEDLLNRCKDGVRCNKSEHQINNRALLVVASGRFLWYMED